MEQTKLVESLTRQAVATQTNLLETFKAECKARDIRFECITFEGAPIQVLCNASQTHYIIVTGHDTDFRGGVREPLSEMVEKLLSITPRPIVVSSDDSSDTDNI